MSFTAKLLLISAAILILVCLIGVGMVFLVYQPLTPLTATPSIASILPTQIPVPQTSWYQVYFTAPIYPDKATNHHGGLDEKLTAFINTAQSSVDMASYQLDLPNVTQALIAANKRGLTVRLATDISTLQDPKENASYKELEQAGISIVGGNPNAIMHNKFVVVDRSAVWLGSWNFTKNDTYRYNNNALVIFSPDLAKNYTVTFEKMFVDKKFGAQRKPGGTTPRLTIAGISVENYFAPEDKVAEKIVPRLESAAHSIDFMAFSFTEDALGAAVISRAKTGVQVRGVFENTGSETQYSEFGKMKNEGLDVLQDGNPFLMHHKVFIVDARTVILGSFNFSQNAEEENDENLVIVDDPSLAAQFEAEFGRVYSLAKNQPAKK